MDRPEPRPPAIHHAQWGEGRRVTRKAFSYRFEVIVGADASAVHNVQTAKEALKLARLYANSGSEVSVRDRTRRGYLDEVDLTEMAEKEADA